jgi:hypothetical protein
MAGVMEGVGTLHDTSGKMPNIIAERIYKNTGEYAWRWILG